MAKSKTKAADKEPEKEQAPSHSPRIGDRVPVILRNGKERFLDVVAVITDDTPLDNVTVKGTLHSLGLEDGESNIVTSGTFRYSKTDEDETGKFPILTWHYPDDELQPKPEPVACEDRTTSSCKESGRRVKQPDHIEGQLARGPNARSCKLVLVADLDLRRRVARLMVPPLTDGARPNVVEQAES